MSTSRYNLRSCQRPITKSAHSTHPRERKGEKRKNNKQAKDHEPLEPTCKKQMTLELQDDSPFEKFLKKSANMRGVWEKIMHDLSAFEVGKCMKVSRGFRCAFGQCLATNSKLLRRMDVAATSEALAKGRVLSTHQVHFKRHKYKSNLDYIFYDDGDDRICSLDGVLYHQQNNLSTTNIIRTDPTRGKPIFQESLYTGYKSRILTRPEMGIHPTTEGNRVLFRYKMVEHNVLAEMEPKGVKIIPQAEYNLFGNCNPEKEVVNTGDPGFPFYARYLLFAEDGCGEQNNGVITMITLNGEGNYDKSIRLYQFASKCPFFIHHVQSKEEAKMLIAFHEKMAVHDSKSGAMLWTNKIEEVNEDGNSNSHIQPFNFFITKAATGFMYWHCDDADPKHFSLRVQLYDTKDGGFIANLEMPRADFEDCEGIVIEVRGPFICYAKELTVHAIKVVGKETRVCEFDLPINSNRSYIHNLLGFPGKTNILLGNLVRSANNTSLFTLDLDAAFSANNKTEVNKAFAFPLVSSLVENRLNASCKKPFLPMYRTDKEEESIDLVGVMKTTISRARDKLTVDTCIFVTNFEFPDYCYEQFDA